MGRIILISLPEDELESLIQNSVDKVIRNLNFANSAPKPEEEMLTEDEVSRIFKVSKVSVWTWEKKGLLKSYRIGNLKRYKKSEILESPKLIIRKK